MTLLAWAGAQLRPGAPGFWLALDLLTAALLWLPPVRTAARGQTLARPLRWLLLAGGALLAGAVAPQTLGLAGVDWQLGLTLGLGLTVGLLALLALARLAVPEPAAPPAPSASNAARIHALLYMGAQQMHWCFQRAALLLIFAGYAALPGVQLASPAYWATWAAVLLALPGLLAVPAGTPRLYSGVALLATAMLFFYTRNFWLCWALHAGVMAFAGAAWLRPALRTA